MLLVVTRWKDFGNRIAIRKSWGKILKRQQTHLKFKVIFVINFDKKANVWHYMKIKKEKRKFKDLMITKADDNYKIVGKYIKL